MTELYHSLYSTADRVVLSTWCLICLFVGLVGNILIVFTSSLFSPTNRIDRVSRIFIRHLALSDALYLLLRVLPSFLSHVFGGWVLGESTCWVEGSLYLIPVLVSMAVILCLNILKVVVCLAPLRARSVSSTGARVVGGWIWVQSSVVPIICMCWGIPAAINSQIETICEIQLNSSVSFELVLATAIQVQIWLPALSIIPCNFVLWFLAHKYTKSHNISSRKAITTILAISFLFVISWIPTIIEESWRHFGDEENIPLWFNKMHINFYFISIMGNPVLYALINRRYRTYFLKQVVKLQEIVMSSSSATRSPGAPASATRSPGAPAERRDGKHSSNSPNCWTPASARRDCRQSAANGSHVLDSGESSGVVICNKNLQVTQVTSL